jgi:hypothetical protein
MLVVANGCVLCSYIAFDEVADFHQNTEIKVLIFDVAGGH